MATSLLNLIKILFHSAEGEFYDNIPFNERRKNSKNPNNIYASPPVFQRLREELMLKPEVKEHRYNSFTIYDKLHEKFPDSDLVVNVNSCYPVEYDLEDI